MPWITAWTDPATGASFPASYVRAGEPQPDIPSRRVTFGYRRWVSVASYSLGLQPIQTVETQLSGTGFVQQFASIYQQAQQQFVAQLQAAAGSYVSGLAEFSGAQVVA